MTDWKKNSIAVPVSIETLTMFASRDWRRKIGYTEEIPVPEQEWDEYHEAVALLERLREFGNFNEGCSCEHAHIEEPRPRTIFHYAETEEEWEARVWAKLDAGEQPDKQALNFNQDVLDFYFGESAPSSLPKRPADGAYEFKVQSLGRARGWYPDGPSASEVADHVREQARLGVFDKECND